MLTLNDNFKEITSHMAILFNEINELVQQLNDGVEPHELPKLTASLREKREKHAELKAELCELGSVESETAPIGHAHFGVERDFPDGYRDGQYYLDND